MSIITGYPSQEKEDRSVVEPATLNRVDPFRFALDILAHLFVRLIGSDSVEADSTTKVINATGHSALPGDTIRFTSGTFSGYEVVVSSVTTNTITIGQQLASAPAAAVSFNILRHTKPLVSSDGTLQVSGGGGGGGETIAAGTRHAGSMTAAALAAGFANLLTPGVAIRSWRIMNFTDGDVVYSLDGGVTTHGAIAPGKEVVENYGSNFLELTDAIHVKDGTKVATAGTVYAIAYSG